MPGSDDALFGLPRPSKALIGLMIALVAIWLSLAIGLNWGGAPTSVFYTLAGNSRAVLHGEVWRLLTAPFIHDPTRAWHVLSSCLGLYFFGPSLEERWGTARLMRFLALTSVIAYAIQIGLEAVLPASIGSRLVAGAWYGPSPAITAMVIAWALHHPHSVVRLFFMVPVSGRMLIAITVGWELFRLASAQPSEEGLIAPFGGIFCGWLIGGGTPSPLRRWWLKLRLAQLDGKSRREITRRRTRPNPGGLRVITGGRKDDDDDKGPDGRWLN
jgi:membrane associated rhomboid family serine protease